MRRFRTGHGGIRTHAQFRDTADRQTEHVSEAELACCITLQVHFPTVKLTERSGYGIAEPTDTQSGAIVEQFLQHAFWSSFCLPGFQKGSHDVANSNLP